MRKRIFCCRCENSFIRPLFCFLMVLMTISNPASAQQSNPSDLGDQSLENLMNIQVSSVSKQDQRLSQTAAAVFVITQQDIRTSGATNIPDLLRMVPGLYVAQINANTWAITARGFNGRFSNELLVLLDGRSVYSQTTGGVFWDVFDLPLEDIDRIEVIRGPGGTIWGANAVNGVINILTRSASQTHGATVVAGGGTLEPAFGTIQYGGKAKSTDYRLFAKYFDYNRSPNLPGETAADDWHALRGGFRADTSLSKSDTVMVQGDMYTGKEGVGTDFGQSLFAPNAVSDYNVPLSGGFFQGVWKHTPSDRWDTSLEASYDTYERYDVLHEGRRTFDVQFQHHFLGGRRQEFTWGLENRYSLSQTRGAFFVSLVPPTLDSDLFSGFIQDQVVIRPDRLYLTVGTRIEHNYYTAWNIIPSVRLAWTPTPNQTLWGAVSRAPRTPADTDESIRVNFATIVNPSGPPVILSQLGNSQLRDEDLNAYEFGYRTDITRRVSLDLALYYNDYNNQVTQEPEAPFFESSPAPAHLVVPFVYQNLMHGEAHGVEVSARFKATNRWTLSPGYAFEKIHMHLSPLSQDSSSVSEAQGSTPVHSAQIRSDLAITNRIHWNGSAYFTGQLMDPIEPSYTRLDTGILWQLAERSSVSVFGQNLLRDHHTEFVDSNGSAQTMLIKRSAYARFTFSF